MKKNKKSQISPVEATSEEDYFDDCPICQALKKAEKEGREITLTELQEAIGKAQKQGAIVGGSLWEKD